MLVGKSMAKGEGFTVHARERNPARIETRITATPQMPEDLAGTTSFPGPPRKRVHDPHKKGNFSTAKKKDKRKALANQTS